MNRYISYLGAASVAFLSSNASMADSLVVRITGPSAALYPAGKQIPASAKLKLKTGDQLTLLDSNGTHVFTGPGVFGVSGMATADKGSALIALIKNTGVRQVRTASVRGEVTSDALARPTSMWTIDIAKAGNFCVIDAAHIKLWRRDASGAASMAVQDVSTGESLRPKWRIGQNATEIASAHLAFGHDVSYKFQYSDLPAITVTLKLLKATPQSALEAAKQLLDNGCSAQMNQLIAAGQ